MEILKFRKFQGLRACAELERNIQDEGFSKNFAFATTQIFLLNTKGRFHELKSRSKRF